GSLATTAAAAAAAATATANPFSHDIREGGAGGFWLPQSSWNRPTFRKSVGFSLAFSFFLPGDGRGHHEGKGGTGAQKVD
ncbi:hypothetical protein BO99DRAFT_447578, partial [Aspergillus violaceofuscus CBS 115571]